MRLVVEEPLRENQITPTTKANQSILEAINANDPRAQNAKERMRKMTLEYMIFLNDKDLRYYALLVKEG